MKAPTSPGCRVAVLLVVVAVTEVTEVVVRVTEVQVRLLLVFVVVTQT